MRSQSFPSSFTRTLPGIFAASVLALSASHVAAQQGATQMQPQPAPASVNQQAIDSGIAEDAGVAGALAVFRTRVAELNKPIARLDSAIEKRGIGGGALGNFVADAMRAEASRRTRRRVPFAVVNTGGIRKNSIAAGALTEADIYEMLPFENALVVVELAGEQLLRLLDEVTKARDAQGGTIVTFTADADDRNPRFVSAVLEPTGGRRNRPIKPTATYTIVTLDYLIERGGNYAVLKDAKRKQPLNVVLRDAVIEHLRGETARGRGVSGELDGRFRRAAHNATNAAATVHARGGKQ